MNRPGRPFLFTDQSERCVLACFVKFHSVISEEKSKMYQSIRGRGGQLGFPIGPKNTNLVEDTDILFPVKIR